MPKVWFITGTSRGFGRQFAIAALGRGDLVAATARHAAALADLQAQYGAAVLALSLDVTDRAAVGMAIQRAHAHFGRLDVIVNNAGYGLFGTVEEVTEEQVRAQLETNFFGPLWVCRAALPLLRRQGSGHIVQISSTAGLLTAPNLGVYAASKWALEAMSEAMAGEVAPYGIKVTLVEPGGYATDWSTTSKVVASPDPAYDHVRAAMVDFTSKMKVGDPTGVGSALLKVVDASQPPRRVIFGEDGFDMVRAVYAERLQNLADWQHLSVEAATRP
ncbi:SDR family NAD(P)-dependent oxidoreductase [Streptomyces canus]|uniref:SDR family NAD(P)-dependent oxidoreductase n=1 Tax=Streptomyces canus TaxID=58343 RepID=UPI0033D1EAC3